MHPSPLTDDLLARLTRFAALLAGDGAEGDLLVRRAVRGLAGRLRELRGGKGQGLLLAKKVREAAAGRDPAAESPLAGMGEVERVVCALAATGLVERSDWGPAVGLRKVEEPDGAAVESARAWAERLALTAESLAAVRAEAERGAAGWNQALMAGVCGLAVLVGVAFWMIFQSRQAFEGRESVESLVASADGMTGAELETVEMPSAEMGDWLYMRGFEGFAVPGEVGRLRVIGARVYRAEEHPVAQLAFAEGEMVGWIFRATDFGVTLEPAGKWRYVAGGGWSGAVRRDGELCTLVGRRGEEGKLREFVSKLR